ncbi:ABC transporter ATP-binding protein [Thermomonospora cellulosilytica]|uniref:Iron complex transport system ATP-binding protein n=1 Tax=Thermomonospora cellulosilytica TaxID=1411118 RepID=A0A7W3R7F9_9ACTN|nr:ABC transporter ATP-binding protein [Thermomonospora cellulosilytica]MBA9002596.1 iron complex transport system ATP-binding protein [Thermomonospora cellulosilytica]
MLVLDALTVGYPGRRGRAARRVLERVDAEARAGDLTVLIGPNGTGKSTLLRTLAGLQPPLEGKVLLDGSPVAAIGPAELARRVAVVLTERDVPALLTGRELAALGRHPHTGFTGRLTAADRAAVDWALTAVDAAHLAERPVTELSDGERQRILTARALAQEPAAILLDEPTAFLDVPSRVALMGLLRRLARERSLVVVVSTHDLELALRIADRVWLITRDGGLHRGTPEELALNGAISAAFDGGGLTFDAASGVFVLPGGSRGTAHVTAPGLHRPLLERALSREGWRPVPEPPADLTVTWDGEAYEATRNGTSHRFPTLAAFTGWLRRP